MNDRAVFDDSEFENSTLRKTESARREAKIITSVRIVRSNDILVYVFHL